MRFGAVCFQYMWFIAVILLSYFSYIDANRQNRVCSPPIKPGSNGTGCNQKEFQFRCLNGKCLQRSWFCDNGNDCGDNSDERYCRDYYERCPASYVRCKSSARCIPEEWICNGHKDCTANEDEEDCDSRTLYRKLQLALSNALDWMATQVKTQSSTGKWGMSVHKKAVSLFLAGEKWSEQLGSCSFSHKQEMAYEITIKLLSQVAQKSLQGIPSSELASIVNGLIVSCLNPKEFYGMNLVQELRRRIDTQNYTNPYIFLTMCSAGETITEEDKKKLVDEFSKDRTQFWTDTKALIVMALACAKKQSEGSVSADLIQEMTLDLKSKQYRNGTVENLRTTALVMQALYASDQDADPENYDEEEALQQILQHQKSDGSFGSFMNTYYVLPVLNCNSLANISSHHCETVPGDEDTARQYLSSGTGPKVHVQYSIWIGDEKNIERTTAVRVAVNTSLYRVMEVFSDLDDKYKFDYTMKNRKPYITGIAGIQDDPEMGEFWFLYVKEDSKLSPIEKSPADIKPKNNDHFVLWYRSGPWTKQVDS